MRRTTTLAVAGLLACCWAGTAYGQEFEYRPAGELESGTEGRTPQDVWVPDMRFPLREAPAYANSQVYGHGGSQGPDGSQCDEANYSYPWWDNYCEPRQWEMPLCPGGTGHQGQDIRPKECRDATYWVVAAEPGTIIDDQGVAIKLKTDSGRTHRYLHLAPSSIVVDVGDELEVGDRIGKISNYTGGDYPTTYHLHYDIKQYVASDPNSGAAVEQSAFIPPYPSLVESYRRLIGDGGGGGGAEIDVRLQNGEDIYQGGTSDGIADYFPGETVRAEILLKNATSSTWPTQTWLGYELQTPYLRDVAYRIESDHPNHDQSTWSVNSADSAEENPPDGELGPTGRWLMHAFSSGETKRVVLELEAGAYSIGAVDHPDVRAWLQHIEGLYGPQEGYFADPGSNNAFGDVVRELAQIDILSRDHWHFDGGETSATEGWSAEGGSGELQLNTEDGLITQQVDGEDARMISPDWTRIEADRWNEMVLRLRSHDGPHRAAIYWAREGESFSSDRRIAFDAPGSGELVSRVLSVGDHDAWSGTVVRLRVDLLEGTAPGEEDRAWYGLDELFLQSSETEETNTRRNAYVEPDPEPPDSGDVADGRDVGLGADAGAAEDETGPTGGNRRVDRGSDSGCRTAPGTPGPAVPFVTLLLLAGLRRVRPG